MDARIGVIAVLVHDATRDTVDRLNQYLSDYGDLIVGRMGVPYRERGYKVMAIIVDGTTDQLGALTGKLGALPGITTKATLLTK